MFIVSLSYLEAEVCDILEQTLAKFHGSANRKQRIGAYRSREFCAYGKHISRVSGDFLLLRVRTSRH